MEHWQIAEREIIHHLLAFHSQRVRVFRRVIANKSAASVANLPLYVLGGGSDAGGSRVVTII